jgi:tetratricopeptide (TPR) repeat protein
MTLMPDISQENDRIDSWKSIAAFFGRDERTVKRWEKERALPVHRVPGRRGGVFAYKHDLHGWLHSTAKNGAATPDQGLQTDSPNLEIDQEMDLEAETETLAFPARRSAPNPSPRSRHTSGLLERLDPTPFSIGEFAATPAGTEAASLPNPRRSWLIWAAALVFVSILGLAWAGATHHFPFSRTAIAESPAPVKPISNSLSAYPSKIPGVEDLYLQGTYSYEQRTPDSIHHALKCFQDAIAKDPGYAPAYAGLAATYNLSHEYLVVPADEAFPKAEAAARKAIALNPNLAQAHAALGFALFFGDWDTAGAEREFQAAVTLDPNASLPHAWYGSVLTHEARYPEAVKELDQAYRIQPSSTAILSSRAFAMGLGGRRNEAADLLQEVINEDRDARSAHLRLAILSLIPPRDIPRYLEETRRVEELEPARPNLAAVSAAEQAYHSGGEAAMWRAIIRQEQRSRNPVQAPRPLDDRPLYESASAAAPPRSAIHSASPSSRPQTSAIGSRRVARDVRRESPESHGSRGRRSPDRRRRHR